MCVCRSRACFRKDSYMKRFTCGLLTAALTAGLLAMPAAAKDFSDIQGHWGQSAIQQVTDWGLFSGTGEDTFSPDLTMTRGMFVTVMAQTARMLQVYQEPAQEAGFEDVSDADYYADAAAWAKENGLVAGVDATHFGPNSPISREQMCVIMGQFLKKFTEYDLTAYQQRENAFLDKAEIADYARESVNLCVSLGLVSGVPADGGVDFQPRMPATRAAVAVVLGNLVAVTEKLPELPPEPEQPEQPGGGPGGGTGEVPGGEPTEEEKAEEAKVAEYLQVIVESYSNSQDVAYAEPVVKDALKILMGCIEDALARRDKGQFLDRAFVQQQYAGEISRLKSVYDSMTDEQFTSANSIVLGLASSEQLYFVLEYFGVDYFA